jgi:beta-glucosidase-like glycosyl hydrolase
VSDLARLIFPALRWHARTGYGHERARIDATLKLGVGGYIIFGGKADAARRLTTDLQAASAHPLLIGSDFERGAAQQVDGLTHLPPAAALGFLDDAEVAAHCGEITASEARSVGINWVYAPVADLDIEPENPIVQTRSFGDDPEHVGRLVQAWVGGAQRNGVAACAKHYPGHGRATSDSHTSLPAVRTSLADLEATDLQPFRWAIAGGVRSVMSAHVAYPDWDASGLPATLSSQMLGYLRMELGFEGLIVTDALIMEGALRGRGEARACEDAVRAGCDALLYPVDAAAVTRAMEKAVTADQKLDARAKDAVERVAQLAESLKGDPVGIDIAAHREFADAVADLTLHTLRGESLNLRRPVSVVVVDDDVGGPYAVGPRGIFAKKLAGRKPVIRPGGSRLLLVYSEPRSWKGHAMLSRKSVAAIKREIPRVGLVILFGHPRLIEQIPGEVPVLCAWHGQPLMQEAAARWVVARLR